MQKSNPTASARLDPNSVLGKVQTILEAFGPDDEHLGLTELATRAGVSKASVHRIAQELLSWGVLERSGSHYRLGMRLFTISQKVPRQRILREAARPHLEDVHRATGATIHLAVLDGFSVLYLDKINPRGQVTQPSRVAGRMPLHCTATGRVLLAFGPRFVAEEVLSSPLDRLTPYTTVMPKLVAQELTKVRQRGFAIEREQTRVGYCSVATPLWGRTGAIVGAISLTAPTFRADTAKYAEFVGAASQRVSRSIADMVDAERNE